MKKFFAIALIAGALVSCNQNDKTVTETTGSDTTTIVTPVANDTTQVVTDTTVKTTITTDTNHIDGNK